VQGTPEQANVTIHIGKVKDDARVEQFLDGRLEIHSKRGVRGADRVLIGTLDQPLTGSVLSVGSRHCGVALAARALHPELQIHSLHEDAHVFRNARRQCAVHPELPLALHLGPRPNIIPVAENQDFATVLLSASHAGDAQLTTDLLQECHRALRPRGKLIAAIDNSRDRWLHDRIVRLFGAATLERNRRGSLYISRKTTAKPRYRNLRRSFTACLFGKEITLDSIPGVFSHGELDEGTLALAETIAVDPGDTVLDLGCGVGAIGIAAAAASGTGYALLVDSSTRAVETAQQNIRNNGVSNATALLACDLAAVRPASFNVVLTNPPYYSDYRISAQFIREGQAALRQGGLFALVTKSPEPHAALLLKAFRKVDQVERRGYTVFMTTRS
jgi:16S rRNA G1207 methylase RsmC